MQNILYHSTKLCNAYNIIKENVLYGDYPYHGNMVMHKGIFTTRSLIHAKHVHGSIDTIILALDKDKLKCNFKIKPIRNYTDDHRPMSLVGLGGNEFEEFIFTNKIEYINDFIIDVKIINN